LQEIKKIFQLDSDGKHFDAKLKISNGDESRALCGQDLPELNNFLSDLKFTEKRILKVISELEKIISPK
jgi:hypothetical protein